jgi:lysyl-tRNA synthetase class 2
MCLTKQLYVEKKVLNESYPEAFNHLTNLVDIGDIVGARGSVKRTDKGELSIKVSSFEILTKAILPLPDKFHGLQDVEKRYRQRCVSLFFSVLQFPGVG